MTDNPRAVRCDVSRAPVALREDRGRGDPGERRGRPPRVRAFDPSAIAQARTAVIIPAQNEAERISACLQSLAVQDVAQPAAIYLCINNTGDDTAEVALETLSKTKVPLVLAEFDTGPGGVGEARCIGHCIARRFSPEATALLSTDADCLADRAWIRSMEEGLCRAPAVLGRIDPIPEECAALPGIYHARGRIEAAYMTLAMAFERLMETPGLSRIGLNTAGGANLGILTAVYGAVGGYRSLAFGEDRDLVDRVIAAGFVPDRLEESRVRTSTRSAGRAPGGMSYAIAARLRGRDCPLDTALLPFEAMIDRQLGNGSGRASRAMTVSEAVRDTPALEACIRILRTLPHAGDRRGYLWRLRADLGRAESGRTRPARGGSDRLWLMNEQPLLDEGKIAGRDPIQ